VPVKVTVCVGSSCHIRGSRDMLERFAEILKQEDLNGEVALVGSFCMERCGECMNWQFDDEDVSSRSVEEAEQTLRKKLREVANQEGSSGGAGSPEADG